MVKGIENRKFVRFNFQKSILLFPVVYSKSGNIYEIQVEPIRVWANNIGEGGLRLEGTPKINTKLPVKLCFEFVKDQPVEVYGRIAWTLDHHCGIRFLGPDEDLNAALRAIVDLEDRPDQLEPNPLRNRKIP